METAQYDELAGRMDALCTAVAELMNQLQPLQAARLTVALAIEVQVLEQMRNRTAMEEAKLQALTAFRDCAHEASRAA